jgi:SAM-dependent methyltransferase
MAFEVSPLAYDRFMGRYSGPLATSFADLVDLHAGQRALDVGCGTGALTAVLVQRLGAQAVEGIDPSQSFISALTQGFPETKFQLGTAEKLPYADAQFDRTLAQLVVHFMSDPTAGLAEMARVTRPGGIVAANVWDFEVGPLALFWRAARELDASAIGERDRPGSREGQLAELFTAAGMTSPSASRLTVRVIHPHFEDWWDPFTLGVGPAGSHVQTLTGEEQAALREHCRELLPEGPFPMTAAAWTVSWTKLAR